jgi:hypothetical protein
VIAFGDNGMIRGSVLIQLVEKPGFIARLAPAFSSETKNL